MIYTPSIGFATVAEHVVTTLFAFCVLESCSVFILFCPIRANGVRLALSGGVAVAEVSTGTCTAAGMGAVVPSEALSLGAVFGGTGIILGNLVVVLRGFAPFALSSACIFAVSSNAQVAGVRIRIRRPA